jgi:hypothetical protein
MRRTPLAQETAEYRNRPIVERCENWGKCLRLFVAGWSAPSPFEDRIGSAEASCVSDRYRTNTPSIAIGLDVEDAKAVESAAATLLVYPHALLKAWYVRAYSPGRCLAYAAGLAGVKKTSFRSFDLHLETAHRMLTGALELPLSERILRARARAKAAIGLPSIAVSDN